MRILSLRWVHLIKHCYSPWKVRITHKWPNTTANILVSLLVYSANIRWLLHTKYWTGRQTTLSAAMDMPFPETSGSFYRCRSRIQIQSLYADTYPGIVTEQVLFKPNSSTILTTSNSLNLPSHPPCSFVTNVCAASVLCLRSKLKSIYQNDEYPFPLGDIYKKPSFLQVTCLLEKSGILKRVRSFAFCYPCSIHLWSRRALKDL